MANQQIRILDYMHIASKSLHNDSNFLFHKSFFNSLFKKYPNNFHFYTTYPQSEENDRTMRELSKKHPQITPVPIEYYSTNAFFRNALDWKSMQKNCPDFDIIFNNTPEIGFELLSYAISKGIYCNMINYAHWYANMINGPIFANYYSWQTEKFCMEAKYLYNFAIAYKNLNNSKYGVKKIMEGFEQLPDSKWINLIRQKTQHLYMSVDVEEINKYKPENIIPSDIPILVFNHRHLVYTGFTDFMIGIEKIIQLRPDLKFKIFLSSGGNVDLKNKFNIPEEYYYTPENKSFSDYIKILWNCNGIQIGSHTGQNQWSLSFLDGMFCNLIPFYRRNVFFDELFEGLDDMRDYNYYNDVDFIEKLIYMIENFEVFREKNNVIYEHFLNNWTWDNFVDQWAEVFIDTYEQVRTYKNSEKIDNINVDNINFPITWGKCKKILNISDQRPTNQYRKTLKDRFNLKEDIENKEIILYKEGQKIRKTRGWF